MNSIAHLSPCVNPVTVCAEKPQVPFVCLPVFEPIKPISGSLSFPEFFLSINMVNVKNAVVVSSAFNALTSKFSNECKLFLPVFWVFMSCKAVFIPVVSSARFAAKPVFAFFAAVFTWLFFTPSIGQVASPTAKLASAILEPVSMYLKLFGAMFAALCNLCFLSHVCLLNTLCNYKPKYFDIACERISRAVAQGQLFAPEPMKQVQEVLV